MNEEKSTWSMGTWHIWRPGFTIVQKIGSQQVFMSEYQLYFTYDSF